MPTKAINLRIDEELLKYLNERAEEEHRTLSNMIISILEEEKANNPFIVAGAEAEMLVDGVWHKGKIVKGYRYNDGIVTIETDDGHRFWCGQSRTDVYRLI